MFLISISVLAILPVFSLGLHIWEAPYTVSIKIYKYGGEALFCAGAIVDTDIVLSVAHCLEGISAENIKVRAGSAELLGGGQTLDVDSVRIHEDYTDDGGIVNHDLAILLLKGHLKYTGTIQNINITKKYATLSEKADLTGWWPMTPLESEAYYSSLRSMVVNFGGCVCLDHDFKEFVCCATFGSQIFYGGSGSPLTYNGKLYGLLSYQIDELTFIFTNMEDHQSWVRNATRLIKGTITKSHKRKFLKMITDGNSFDIATY